MPLEWPLHSLLPHSGRMVLIQEPASTGEDWAEASVLIAEDSMFYEVPKGIPAWVGIEYMAQTVALFAGVEAKRAGQDVRIGLLLGSRRYRANVDYFPLGSRLRIRGDRVWQDDKMAVFDCRIDAAECVAYAQLNVYQTGENEPLLK